MLVSRIKLGNQKHISPTHPTHTGGDANGSNGSPLGGKESHQNDTHHKQTNHHEALPQTSSTHASKDQNKAITVQEIRVTLPPQMSHHIIPFKFKPEEEQYVFPSPRKDEFGQPIVEPYLFPSPPVPEPKDPIKVRASIF